LEGVLASSPANPLSELLARKGVLLADGATGTNLFAQGLVSGEAPELWNENEPGKILDLHRGFLAAGADIILTNSFGGTRQRLKLHGADGRVVELNRRAAALARKAASGFDRTVIVAGSVGPTGELMQPLGALTFEDAVAAFGEQIEGLKAGGADVIWIETMSAADEIRAAAQAAQAAGMPYVFTASFDTAGRTMMGMAPAELPALAAAQATPPVAVGANCGVGASDLLSSILDMSAAAPDAILIAKANCGIPVVRGDAVEYTGTPQVMARYACLAVDAGARIVGGCCGTACEHLAAMRLALDNHAKAARPDLAGIAAEVGPLVNKTAGVLDAAPKRERGGRRRA
jgi:5-methyltetrahydrofolate--homocysteine methyltransferase